MKQFVKRVLIAIIPSKLNPRQNVLYLKTISQLYSKFTKKISISSINYTEEGVYRVNFVNGDQIYVPQAIRISRFISGKEKAFLRILEQYHINKFSHYLTFSKILDVGSNIGEFAMAICEASEAISYCIEPVPANYLCLEKNTSGYKKRIKCSQLALGPRIETASFHVSQNFQNSSFVPPDENSSKIMVQTATLDFFLKSQHIQIIDLLKVDAEGYEPEVLEGLSECLHKVRNFAIDCSPERQGKNTTKQVSTFFEKNNIHYKIFEDLKSRRIIILAGEDLSG